MTSAQQGTAAPWQGVPRPCRPQRTASLPPPLSPQGPRFCMRAWAAAAHLWRLLWALFSNLGVLRHDHQHAICRRHDTAHDWPHKSRGSLGTSRRAWRHARHASEASHAVDAANPCRHCPWGIPLCPRQMQAPAPTAPAHPALPPSRTRARCTACQSSPRRAAPPARSSCRCGWCSPPAAEHGGWHTGGVRLG